MFAAECGLDGEARASKFFMVEETGIGREYPFSDEKLALVLTVYRARSFDDAVDKVRAIMEFKGKGHSVGIHTEEIAHARRLAEELDTARVLVNMAHTFGNGGGFDSGLNFTLSMGCGTWQGNSISENLNYRHFLNITHLAVPIPGGPARRGSAVRRPLGEVREVGDRPEQCPPRAVLHKEVPVKR